MPRLLISICWLCCICGVIAFTGCQPEPPPAPPPPAPVEIAPQKAEVGVGKKGQSLQDNVGVGRMISAPAATFFNVKQRLVFDVEIPKAMQLFNATNGRMPKSNDEFMQQIIKANYIALPELPAGSVYRFNTEKGELWVYPESQAPQ